MLKHIAAAAAIITVASVFANAAEAKVITTAPLSCKFSKTIDPRTHATLRALAIFNTSGMEIPATATYEVNFDFRQSVRPLHASIPARTAAATGNLANLAFDPFDRPWVTPMAIPCRAYAHWVVKIGPRM
jgi:hypothetical protein